MRQVKESVKTEIRNAYLVMAAGGTPAEAVARLGADHAIGLLELDLPEWFEENSDPLDNSLTRLKATIKSAIKQASALSVRETDHYAEVVRKLMDTEGWL